MDKKFKNIGTIGHIGHGNATLTAAIEKVIVETDRERGITINNHSEVNTGVDKDLGFIEAFNTYTSPYESILYRTIFVTDKSSKQEKVSNDIFKKKYYEEYQLILQKKSKLSAMKRKEILEQFKD